MNLALFAGYGIELEYMIVDPQTLAAKPLSDRILARLGAKDGAREVCLGEVCWSNELVRHVIELKCNGPQADLGQVQKSFLGALSHMQKILNSEFAACLLPTAMHPFFVPDLETVLWDAEDAEIYTTYNRIFGCRGHGWSNLQSIHINLSFANDQEFMLLHEAIRPILPLLPVLAASSPLVEGHLGESDDMRLVHYLKNQKKIPEIIGPVIPESVTGRGDYERKILQPMYRAIASLDPAGELQHEWLNSRAAIPKFEKGCVEIRLLDISECLQVDFAVIEFVVALVKRQVEFLRCGAVLPGQLESCDLREMLSEVVRLGGAARMFPTHYAESLGVKDAVGDAHDLIRALLLECAEGGRISQATVETVQFLLKEGCLAKRIRKAVGPQPTAEKIREVYVDLAQCLIRNVPYGQ